jgi:hypothetical protein
MEFAPFVVDEIKNDAPDNQKRHKQQWMHQGQQRQASNAGQSGTPERQAQQANDNEGGNKHSFPFG